MRLDSNEVAAHLLTTFGLPENMPVPPYLTKADLNFNGYNKDIQDVSKE